MVNLQYLTWRSLFFWSLHVGRIQMIWFSMLRLTARLKGVQTKADFYQILYRVLIKPLDIIKYHINNCDIIELSITGEIVATIKIFCLDVEVRLHAYVYSFQFFIFIFFSINSGKIKFLNKETEVELSPQL